MNIFQVIKVTEILTRFKYASILKIKTHSYQPSTNAGGPLKKVAKVVITLTKSEDFEQVYTEFEKNKPEMKDRRDRRYQTYSKTITTEEKKTTTSEDEKPSETESQEKKEIENQEAKKDNNDDLLKSDSIEKIDGEDEEGKNEINATESQVDDVNGEN